MRYWCLRICLLGTFAFWASGLARFAHEAIEHHGRDASVQPDDDDDDSLAAATLHAGHSGPSKDQHPRRPCVLCQQLTAMSADRSAPPQLPPMLAGYVETLPLVDWMAPDLRPVRVTSNRDPPAAA